MRQSDEGKGREMEQEKDSEEEGRAEWNRVTERDSRVAERYSLVELSHSDLLPRSC